MKKRVFSILLVLCMVFALLPFGASASSITNGELAFNDLKMIAMSDNVINSNGMYQKIIYETYDYDPTVCVLQYNPDGDFIVVSLVSARDTSQSFENLVIPSDLSMPYVAYYEIDLTDSDVYASAFANIYPSFSSNQTLTLYDVNGINGADNVAKFAHTFSTGLQLILQVIQHNCFNDDTWSIGDLGFTAYANEQGFAYGLPIPEPRVSSGTLGKDVYWELDDDVLYIYGSGPMDDYMTYTLGLDIASPLYQIRNYIRTVIIEDGVTNIGGYVFANCSLMEDIYIPPSVTNISYAAFSYCTNLSEIFFPYGLKTIGEGAFALCVSLDDIYYHGSEIEWSKVSIEPNNEVLYTAAFYPYMHYMEAVDGVAPTCTQPGTESYYKCECGKIFDMEYYEISTPPSIPATGHKWDSGKVTKQPTETAEGVKTFTCTACGATRTESISKLSPQPKPPSSGNPFVDVQDGSYYYEPVLWALNHDPQITDGVSADKFAPDKTCTRAQVVTFLWRASGCPEPTKMNNPFTDVKSSDYFYKAVLWAVEKGITDGTSDTTFSPNAPCTRAHVVTFLWRADGKPAASGNNPFNDVTESAYYYKPVLWAVKAGVTDGTSATTFSPDKPCTRGQIVTFLYRDKK